MADQGHQLGVFKMNTCCEQTGGQTRANADAPVDSWAESRDAAPPMPMGRREARRLGLKTFVSARSCSKRDHGRERRVSDAQCVKCIAQARVVQALQVAREVERRLQTERARGVREYLAEQRQAAREKERQAQKAARELAGRARAQAQRTAKAKATREANKAARIAATSDSAQPEALPCPVDTSLPKESTALAGEHAPWAD